MGGGRRVAPTSKRGGTAQTARPRSQEDKSMAQHDSFTRTTGHVKLIQRQSGPKFYAKFRINGHHPTRLIGPAWLKRGRPPEGHFTRAMAEVELRRMMAEAGSASTRVDTVTFQEACDEWLRYLEQEKRVATTTLRHNRSAVNARLAPFFGADTALADVTTGRIDAYRVRRRRACPRRRVGRLQCAGGRAG